MNIHKKKTKIVATIGPASESKDTLKEMAEAGVNVIRCNFSHGDFDEHQRKVDRWREIADERGENLAVLQDLSGPEIRTGTFTDEEVHLQEGDTFTLTTKEVAGDSRQVSVNYSPLPEDVKEGDMILLDDGKLQLEVVGTGEAAVTTKVKAGGVITDRRGINLPDTTVSVQALTDKDREDLEFGVKNNVDFVALSFVQTAEDIIQLRKVMKERDLSAQIIAKIETQQAVDNIDEILEVTDGIMVARGDLAVEIGPEHVPATQKMLINRCNNLGLPVITATQMLESMTENRIPTRAEVSDVANAILDGTDAIMLSGETTVGDNPVASVSVMSQVAQETEARFGDRLIGGQVAEEGVGVVDSVTASAVQTAREIEAEAIVALTNTGFTTRMLSRFKSSRPILTLSPYKNTCRQAVLSFGSYPVQTKQLTGFEPAMESVRKACLSSGIAEKGDKIVVAAGMPFSETRSENVETNMMFVREL